MLEWHDHLLTKAVVPIAPYNPRNTADLLDIDYRIEERIKAHSDTVRLWQKQLEETYSHRSQVETAIGVCKDLGLGTRGSGAERESKHTSSSLCASAWLWHSPIISEEMMSLALPSRYNNSSAPPLRFN
jgi:hypothetical protein